MTVLELETVARCPLCQSAELRPWRVAYDRLYGTTAAKFIYSLCRRCGLRFLSTRPLESEANKVYPGIYGPYAPQAGAVPTTGELAQSFQATYSPAGSRRTLLDYGCGSESFLDWARARGWDTVGIDFSSDVVDRVLQSGHRAYLAGPEAWDRIPDSSVGVVRLNHVLEHLYDPEKVLSEVLGKLVPDGIIHIAVPNPSGVSAITFRAFWLGLEPRHVMLFPPSTLRRLLDDLGFRHIEIIHESITKDAARSLAFLLRARTTADPGVTESFRHSRSLAVALAPFTRIAARVHRGDRFHCFARR